MSCKLETAMPTPRHEAYTTIVINRLTSIVGDRDQRAQVEEYADSAETLLLLDLEPARARLEAGLAANSRGGKPRDVIVVLRLILLGLLIGEPRYNALVRMMRASRVLRLIAGLAEDDTGPGVGTLYAFEQRLLDGAHRARCAHEERPSVTERRRARSPQPKRETAAAAKRAGRARAPTATAASTVEVITKRVAQALPDDFAARLTELLHLVAVIPSAQAGLIGALDRLVVAGDTSVLPTGAATHGKKTCEHPRFERCECPRVYADPDATVGWDANAECTYFGHRFAEVTCGTGKHDLPLAIELNTANVPDVVSGPLLVEHLTKAMRITLPSAIIKVAVFDAGFDAEPIHAYLIGQGIDPVIPLKTEASPHHPTREDLVLSPRGIPMCAGNVEMAPAGSAGAGTKMFTCPLRVGRLANCPMCPAGKTDWHCRPDLKAGPSVVLKIADNPRLCPRIARNSDDYARLYKTRTTCERSNSMKKVRFKLLSARRRRRSGWQFLLTAMAILQHALVWKACADVEGGPVHALLARVNDAERVAA